MSRCKRLALTAIAAALLSITLSMGVYAGETESEYVEKGFVVEYYYPQELEEELYSSGQQRNTLIKQMASGLTIENRTAYIYGECEAYEPADIWITVTLQRKDNGSWKDIKNFSASETGKRTVYIDDSYLVTRDYEYRLKIVGKVDDGSTSETVTKYSSSKTCYTDLNEKTE